jgi:hypothetical protein
LGPGDQVDAGQGEFQRGGVDGEVVGGEAAGTGGIWVFASRPTLTAAAASAPDPATFAAVDACLKAAASIESIHESGHHASDCAQ